MKKSILILAVVLITTSLIAQDKTSFFQSQILGKGKDTAPLQLSVDAYASLFLSSGGGGSLGIEFGNWHGGQLWGSEISPYATTPKKYAAILEVLKKKASEGSDSSKDESI